MSDIPSPVDDAPSRSGRSTVPRTVWWGLGGLVLSAVGVLAMPSPPPENPAGMNAGIITGEAAPAGSATPHGHAGGASVPPAEPVEMAASVPGDIDPTSGADGVAALPSGRPSPSEGEADDRLIGALYRLVDETCKVTPERIVAGPDAYSIDLPLAANDDPCLDEVALQFDREHPGAPQLLFDVLAAEAEQGLPVLHISAMHIGPMPYLHLKSGKTLFVGAVVDGWELSSIDENGAAFTHGDRTFTLRADDDRDPS